MREAAGNLSIVFIIMFFILSCSKSPTEVYPESSVYMDYFEKIWCDFDANYSYFIHKNIDWNHIKNTYEPLLNYQMTYDYFLNDVVAKMLQELKDLHVNLYDKNGQPVPLYTIEISENYLYDDIFFNTYLEGTSYTSNNMFCLGRVSDSIGYIKIRTWNKELEDDITEFHQILDNYQSYYDSYKALIIDVRENSGGSDNLAKSVAGRFANTTKIYAYYKYRNGPDHDDFTPLQSASFSPTGTWQFTKPVGLLIGQRCMSSNEAFILMMSALAHVTTIGDTTRGSSGNPQEYSLEDSTRYTISSWVAHKTDQTVFENVGLFPDIPIPVSESIVDGHDRVLETAIELLE